MINEKSPRIDSDAGDPVPLERRRPGRREYLVPELIRLLRGDSRADGTPPVKDEVVDREHNQLKTFTGIIISVGLSLLIWLTIAVLFYNSI